MTMKWLASFASNTQEIYELWNEDQKLLTLDFHPLTNSARIEYRGRRRVFMIRREGFLKNRIILRNEYGMRMGQLHYEKSNLSAGSLELDGELFNYNIRQGEYPVIQINRASSSDITHQYKLEKGLPLSLAGNLGTAQQAILMTTGWFLAEHTLQEALAS